MPLTKSEHLADKSSPLNQAADHEPIYVLRASDPLAPQAIEAHKALILMRRHPNEETHFIQEAADKFRDWLKDKQEKTPSIAAARADTGVQEKASVALPPAATLPGDAAVLKK